MFSSRRLQQALRDLQYEKDKNKNLEGQVSDDWS